MPCDARAQASCRFATGTTSCPGHPALGKEGTILGGDGEVGTSPTMEVLVSQIEKWENPGLPRAMRMGYKPGFYSYSAPPI